MEYFFFSSRRRNTRSKRDWSSDVCSSDLIALAGFPITLCVIAAKTPKSDARKKFAFFRNFVGETVVISRSEERRVGKEGRGRVVKWHERKKLSRLHALHKITCDLQCVSDE